MSNKNVETQVREMGRDIVLMLKDVKLKNGFEVDGVAINIESNAFQFHGYSFHNGDVEELIMEGELDCVKDFADDIKGFHVLEDAELIITDYDNDLELSSDARSLHKFEPMFAVIKDFPELTIADDDWQYLKLRLIAEAKQRHNETN